MSLADKVLAVFISESSVEISIEHFLAKWIASGVGDKETAMSFAVLSRLPFLKIIESKEGPDAARIRLRVEKDDCCEFCRDESLIGAAEFCCERIHHRFECESARSVQCRPSVSLLQRIRDCLTWHG